MFVITENVMKRPVYWFRYFTPFCLSV